MNALNEEGSHAKFIMKDMFWVGAGILYSEINMCPQRYTQKLSPAHPPAAGGRGVNKACGGSGAYVLSVFHLQCLCFYNGRNTLK